METWRLELKPFTHAANVLDRRKTRAAGGGFLAREAGRLQEKTSFRFPEGSDYDRQARMIRLSRTDLSVALALKPFVMQHLDEIAERFYATIGMEPSLMELIRAHSTLERLKGTLKAHIVEMFSGEMDEQYVDKRIRIAQKHFRIGLPTKWYMCAFQDMMAALMEAVERHLPSREDYVLASSTIARLLSIEQQIVLEAFDRETDNRRRRHLEEKLEIGRRIGASSEELAAITEESGASLEMLSGQAGDILEIASSVSGISASIEESANEGKRKLDSQADTLRGLQAGMSDIARRMVPLRESAEEIQAIAQLVRDIADQTGLLALNAAIEAARAGEEGRGFAVVAGEVRKLADQTKQSAEGAAELIRTIHSQILSMAGELPSMESRVTRAAENMEETNRFFEQLVADMGLIREKNGEIEREIRNMNAAADQLRAAVDQLSEAAENLSEMAKEL